MYILSPKTNFLGGSLVSASHLGKLIPGQLLTWMNKSEFLDSNNVKYDVITSFNDYYKSYGDCSSIWCNDTCIDQGYFPEYIDQNKKLWEFLGNFETVHLVNHQPVNRYKSYLKEMISYLTECCYCEVILYNYRACWNIEWDNELACLFPNIKVYTLPYHYYTGYIPQGDIPDNSNKINSVVAIGRSNSRCKIQYKFSELKLKFKEYTNWLLTQVLPDTNKGNSDFLLELSKFKYILTGYYYGGEGNREQSMLYNKLEWSFMDALLMGCIPLTNTLFEKELNRLNIPAPIIGYEFEGINSIVSKLESSKLNDPERMKLSQLNLLREIDNGNDILKQIILEDRV